LKIDLGSYTKISLIQKTAAIVANAKGIVSGAGHDGMGQILGIKFYHNYQTMITWYFALN
jgi:hypothetical protein